mgnify:CR=1 FL=1
MLIAYFIGALVMTVAMGCAILLVHVIRKESRKLALPWLVWYLMGVLFSFGYVLSFCGSYLAK